MKVVYFSPLFSFCRIWHNEVITWREGNLFEVTEVFSYIVMGLSSSLISVG